MTKAQVGAGGFFLSFCPWLTIRGTVHRQFMVKLYRLKCYGKGGKRTERAYGFVFTL